MARRNRFLKFPPHGSRRLDVPSQGPSASAAVEPNVRAGSSNVAISPVDVFFSFTVSPAFARLMPAVSPAALDSDGLRRFWPPSLVMPLRNGHGAKIRPVRKCQITSVLQADQARATASRSRSRPRTRPRKYRECGRRWSQASLPRVRGHPHINQVSSPRTPSCGLLLRSSSRPPGQLLASKPNWLSIANASATSSVSAKTGRETPRPGKFLVRRKKSRVDSGSGSLPSE